MSVSGQYSDIMTGAEVFGVDGDKLGRVAEVYPRYITVEKGFFFPTDYYIPRTALQDVQDGQVFLNMSKDSALNSGWDQVPRDLQADSGAVGTETDEVIAMGQSGATARDTESDEIHIPVAEEELTATVRPKEAGEVRVTKTVSSEDQVLEVPVTEEHLRVERRIVDRPVDSADTAAFEQVVVDVPLREEEVDVQKQARVTEEVVVSKEAVQHKERVADTVRREEVHIDEEAHIDEVNP